MTERCNRVPCGRTEKDGLYPVTFDIGYGMIGKAWFCIEHLKQGTQEVNQSLSELDESSKTGQKPG